ncbi:MAG: hypothetical protein WCR82_05210 [Bacteroidales bacterium]
MKKIKLIVFASLLHDKTSVIKSRSALFTALRNIAEIEILYPMVLSKETEDKDEEAVTVCFIATGGTEEIFKTYLNLLPRPIFLLSDGFHNSLAASFEICTYLKDNGIESKLLNAPLDYDQKFFEYMDNELFSNHNDETDALTLEKIEYPKHILHSLSKTKIGLIGGESPWLISSAVDIPYIEKTYGVQFVNIEILELQMLFEKMETNTPEFNFLFQKLNRFLSGDRTPKDLNEAIKMYFAIKKLCEKYMLNALTIKCFDLLDTCKTTSCLALALLNDEGIVSGCEGDIPSLWTMIYAKALTYQPSFMVNPSSTNKDDYTIDFSHCSVPLTFVHGYRLPSHFESSIGIGVSGSVPCGEYTIMKICGKHLDQIYKANGIIVMNTNVPQRCRTQVRFRFNSREEFDTFMANRIGNHVVLMKQTDSYGI